MKLLIIIFLLILVAEVTYLVLNLNRPSVRRAGRPMFIDTSVLIDGRIVAIAKSGFISDTLMIPRSVIGELQFLADNADSEKRTRARHGLDVVTELQAMDEVTVEIFPDGSKAEEGVDERLLTLAKKHGGALCTIDYNLNKVAQVESIVVVNVNDLAKSLRMAYLPGERLSIALTTKGNDSSQAVGHLEDGTMVVVEQAKTKIGSVVEVEVIRSLQTAAGRMMFARIVDSKPAKNSTPKQSANKPTKSSQSRFDSRHNRSVGSNQSSQTNRKPHSKKPAAKSGDSTLKPNGTAQSNRKKSSKTAFTPRKNNEDRLIELVNSQND